jgi:hypothetical protein
VTRYAWVATGRVYHLATAPRAFKCGVYGGDRLLFGSRPPKDRTLCHKCLVALFPKGVPA